ncbi:MAG TPA: cellulase family glycosylhydrolase [Agromyces sp.]
MPSTLHRTGAALALALAASLAVPTAASAATPAPTPATTSTSSKAAGHGASDRDRGTVTTPDGRTFITDDQGRALQLRGFNAGKWQNDRVTAGDVAAMADQGFNFLRLIVQWEYFEPEQGHYDEAYFDYVESVLDAADREGVHVMLDMHQDVYGPAFGHGGIPAWATRTDGLPYEMDPSNWFNDYFQPAVMRAFTHLYEDADLRAAQEQLWVKLADRLEGHESLLGYDLFNEPFGEFQEGEDLATASGRIEATQLSDMYDRVIGAIRTVDDDAWLFVEPTVLVGYGVPTQLR